MYINIGTVTSPFEVINKLFLPGDTIYFTDSIHRMNGIDYATKVLDSDKNYLGEIRTSLFPRNLIEV